MLQNVLMIEIRLIRYEKERILALLRICKWLPQAKFLMQSIDTTKKGCIILHLQFCKVSRTSSVCLCSQQVPYHFPHFSMVKFFSRLLIVTLMAGPTMASAAFLDDYEGDIDTEPLSECLVLTQNLRLRSRDAKTDGEVSLLQDFLNMHGYLKSEPTGFFSLSTFAAVKAFQREVKLRPTGFVSVLTRRAIEKVSCDGVTAQTVSVTLKSNVTSYREGDTIIFTAKVTEPDGTPLTPQEGATVTLHQLSEDGDINDRDTMSFERRSGFYVLRADDHTTSDDAGRWTAFVTVSKSGVNVGTSEKITYRVIADEAKMAISVGYPNGGETWVDGHEYAPRWTPTAIQMPSLKYVDEYIVNADTNAVVASRLKRENLGWDTWTTSGLPSGRYKFEVCRPSSTDCDMSDGYFTVESSIPDVRVALNPASPSSSTYPRGQKNMELAVIDLRAGAQPVRNLEKIQIAMTSDPSKVFARVSVYDGYRLVGSASSFSYNGEYYYAWINAYNVSVPAYGVTQLTLKADISTTAQPGALFNLGIAGLNFTGQGASTSGMPVYGYTMSVETVVENLPPVIHAITAQKTFVANASGTINIVASDPENRPLTYAVDWGDERMGAKVPNRAGSYVQSATFTHTYFTPGRYTVTIFVKDDIGQVRTRVMPINVKAGTNGYDTCRLDKLDGTNITKQAIFDRNSCLIHLCDVYGPANQSQMSSKCVFMGQEIKRYTQQPYSVSVLSPNGGEIWEIGSTYTISYEVRALSSKFMPGVRIYLEKEYEPGSYKKGINSSTFIGTTSDPGQYTYTVPDIIQRWPGLGSNYRIKVCTDAQQKICDSSDRTFTIRTTPPVANLPPVIDSLSAPTKLVVGQSGQWTVKAHDPENKSLTYAVEWGDEPLAMQKNGIVLAAPGSSFVQTTTFTHTYATPGIYTPKFFVKDDAGHVQSTSASVTVSAVVPDEPPMRVIAPNGNEQWPEGNQYELRWTPTAKQVPSVQFVDVTVVDVNGSTIATLAKDYKNTGYAYWLPSALYGNRIYGKLKIKVCQTGSANCDMSNDYFTITRAQANLPPVIDSIKTPLYVSAGEVTLWTVNARDPENKPLTYAAFWGDEAYPISGAGKPPDSAFGKYSLLNHKYASPGTYAARFFVKDDAGQVKSTGVSVQVQPSNPYGVDACRLDELNGRNVTRGAINDRDICLSKFCDIYGPGNLHLFPSKCVFMGQEIKRYEKTLPKAASATLIGAQTTYVAGQEILFSVRGTTSAGTLGTPEKGFKVAAAMKTKIPGSPSSEIVVVNGVRQDVISADYNVTTGNWDVRMTAPSDSTKTYFIDAGFYCNVPSQGCSLNVVDKSFTFTIPHSLPKAASAELLDAQSTYTAGQPVKINMRGITTEGVVGAPDKGFNVQARLKSTAVSGTVQVDGEYQAVNANFDASSGNWIITLKTPLDTAPTYSVDAAFYCSTPGKGCVTNQINKTATFKLIVPDAVSTPSN